MTGSEATCKTASSGAGSTCSGPRPSTEAAERPENRAAAAEIRAGLTNQPPWNFYHSWKKLKGVPSPDEFGFVDAETATHEGISAWNLLPYQAYFLAQPELKTGAFLTIRDNGVNPIFNFAIGGDWPPGEYVVRIRIAATKHATPERRFVEFGVQATHLSTHEVLGTMDAPQVIEVPFILTKNRGGSFFLREKGTFDTNEQGHRVFAVGEQRNGIGPEFALWVDWAEVEHVPIPEGQMAPGMRALGIPLDDHAPSIGQGDIARRDRAVCDRGLSRPRSSPRVSSTGCSAFTTSGARRVHRMASLSRIRLAVVLASPRFIYLTEQSSEHEGHALSGTRTRHAPLLFPVGSATGSALAGSRVPRRIAEARCPGRNRPIA